MAEKELLSRLIQNIKKHFEKVISLKFIEGYTSKVNQKILY